MLTFDLKLHLFDEAHFHEPNDDTRRRISFITHGLENLLGAASIGIEDGSRDGEVEASRAIRQIGILTTPNDVEKCHIFIAAVFRDPSSVAQILGPVECDPDDQRIAVGLSRAIALFRAARSGALPERGPEFAIHRWDSTNAQTKLVEVLPAIHPEILGADEFLWWTARDHAWSIHRPDRGQHPIVGLFFRYSACSVIGLNLDDVVELLGPAYIWASWALEEYPRPTDQVHPMLSELRGTGRNPLERMIDYAPGWHIDNPRDRLEFLLVRPFLTAVPGTAFEWMDILASHVVMLRRDPKMGLTGVMELGDDLARRSCPWRED